MTSPGEDYRQIGKVLKPHGLRGEFFLFLESDFPQWLAEQTRFFVPSENGMKPWSVERSRFHQGRLILKVDCLTCREDVDAARDTPLFVPETDAREVSQDPDYFFNSDLVGLNLIDREGGQDYGRVIAVYEMPAQNLLEVTRTGGKSYLFPFTRELVGHIDLEAETIEVTMPEGLMDCNSA